MSEAEVTQLFEHAQVLRLEADDLILIRTPHRLSVEHRDKLRAQAKEVFPSHEVIVLDDDLELAVARRVEVDGG